jgi:hypothetical protein
MLDLRHVSTDLGPLGWAALFFAVTGLLVVVAGFVALFARRPLRFVLRTLLGLLLVIAGALLGTIALGIQGYRALTHEEVAARIDVMPLGPQRFSATLNTRDGRTLVYEMRGDEIYVDARVLKWKPWANVLGLHTAYDLERVAGRYRDLEQERKAERTVYALGNERAIDLFALRRRYAMLAPVFDADYGSASFVPVTEPARFELRVSTSGLLLRRVGAPAAAAR